LRVRSGAGVVRSFRVGIGAPGTPTPVGRFAVTDELKGAGYSPVYGCCILALSAHQTRLSSGWTGGDRIAIHGGSTRPSQQRLPTRVDGRAALPDALSPAGRAGRHSSLVIHP
jgi:hypothetical protein